MSRQVAWLVLVPIGHRGWNGSLDRMSGAAGRIVTALELTRLSMAFGAIADLWLIVLLARADPRYAFMPAYSLPLPLSLTCAAIAAIGLFAFGASLNDLLDARHDRAFAPQRPLPAGRIRGGQALVVALASLLASLAASVIFGTGGLILAVIVAGLLLLYNAAAKHVPAAGLVTIGIASAATMMIPNDQFTFTLPAWLTMTHATAVATLVYVLDGKRPQITARAGVLAGIGWLFWSILLIGAGVARSPDTGYWPAGSVWWSPVLPVLAAALFGIVVVRKVRRAKSQAIAAEKVARYGALWQALYASIWLIACGLHAAGLALGAFAAFGFLAMTILKEVLGSSGRPLEWRG